MLRTRVFASADWATELEQPWKVLVAESPTATPFQTWEWQATWWRYYAKRRKAHILAAYDGADLIGLMPMMLSSGVWRTLRALTSGASDYLHPLVRSGYETSFAEVLVSYLQEAPDADLIDLHQIRENQPLVAASQAQGREQANCLVLELPTSFDAYLATLNKSLRYDVRKLDKELFTSGKARIQVLGEDDLDWGLSCFFETHRKRWRKRGLPGAFVGTRSERFHRDWAFQALRNGWLWMSVLLWEERAVGTIYAMRLANTCYYYQAGFDPEASAISPGSLLVGNTIRRAIGEGLTHFDFLRGDEPYKRRWKPQNEYHNLRLTAPTRGLLGQLGHMWNEAGGKVEGRVRARLEGRGLF